MKSIQEIEAMMQEYVTVGNPEAKWKPETVEFFPGVSVEFSNGWDSDYPFAFHVCITFAEVSTNAEFHLGVGVSLAEELQCLAVQLREEIESRAANCVRDELRDILNI